MFEMTAVKNKLSSNPKIEFIQAQKKLLLTSRVGELVGPAVGLDDGCSKDREQEIISCVSNCDVEVCILKKSRNRIDEQQKQLTSAEGLDVGDTDGLLLGLVEGDWLGLDVGFDMRIMRTK